MKICLFTENQYKGGLDTFLINLINAWPNLNDKITLICNKSHPGLETITSKVKKQFDKSYYERFFTNIFAKFSNDKKKSSLFQIFLVRVFFILMFQLLQYPLLFPWYTITLIIFFRRSNFDRLIVVNGGHPASLLCRCAVIAWRFSGKKTKAILNFHNYPMTSNWFFKIPEYLIDKLVLYSCSYIVGVSKDCINSLKQRAPFLKSKKILYIYNGIEDPLLNIKLEKRKRYPADSMHCLMLATYEKRKGHNFLLKAFKIIEKEMPNVFLKIYGYGSKKDHDIVKKMVHNFSLEKKVELNEYSENNFDLILNADLVVVPSQSYESFGLTIIESMALSVPVVVTDVGGMPEVLANSNAGFVCSKDDPLKFAEKVKKILKDSDLREKLKRNGRITYEKTYTAKIMSSQYFQLLQDPNI